MGIPFRIGNALLLIATGIWFLQTAGASAKTLRHLSQPLSEDVQATPEIDERVAYEVSKAELIVDGLDTDDLLLSPYLVSAIYYHDGFLTDFPAGRRTADPERRIVAQISDRLSPERKARFVSLLHELWDRSEPAGPTRLVSPVNYTAASGGRRSHKYAIDLFAPEGSPVNSVSRGVVILADHGWSADDLFSTTSRKGGNAVIVFDPDETRFYRYCHLSTVAVSPGQIIQAGQTIGQVGHTGLNASRSGHGHHLHFEANDYCEGRVHALDYGRLLAMLREWRS